MGPGDLQRLLSRFPPETDPRVLSSLENGEDAGVFLLREGLALVQTVDFFPPVVDDPFLFGAIAAANALSDIYAMGGSPLTALNLAAFPACLELSVLQAVLAGGRKKVAEAGAVLLGGHTIEDDEPKYGLSVTGVVDPSEMMRISGAVPGDLLILTKPLGTGILTTALKGDFLDEAGMSECVDSMLALNAGPSKVFVDAGAHSCTDVTGFGLLGHLREMLLASGVSAELWAGDVPLLETALEMAASGLVPAGAKRNREHAGDAVEIQADIDDEMLDCLFDPQTSGGLLASVDASLERKLLEELGGGPAPRAAVIGRVSDAGTPGEVVLVNGRKERP